MNRKKEVHDWKEERAQERLMLIAPLLVESMDRSMRVQIRHRIARQAHCSERTIRRYEQAYRKEGFNGLKPRSRYNHRSRKLPENFDELLQEAIHLKREVPRRSVEQIIFILEGEGKAEPGKLKRSTLQRHLYDAGFGRRQMQRYMESRKTSSKRFCKPNRMMLVQADIKEGIYLPIGKNGQKKKTYLSSVLDDHSRYILHSQFYDNEGAQIVEDTFRQAILKHGRFDSVYIDNGAQYRSKQLVRALQRLDIRVRYAPPYSGKSKGKIEKFHQVTDDFLAEAKADQIKTLEELNAAWTAYLEEYYQKRPHDGIREYYESQGIPVSLLGISPEVEWHRDQRRLTFLDASVIGEAFQHREKRRVDSAGCLKFHGITYEVSTSLIGAEVEIGYDPVSRDQITVYSRNMDPIQAKPIQIGSYCDSSEPVPAALLPEEPEASRFLKVLRKKRKQTVEKKTDAISFADYGKDGE